MVHKRQGHHGFGNWYSPYPDAGIVSTLGDNLGFRAGAVERGNQQQDLLQDDNRQGLAKGIGEGTVIRL